MFPVTQKDAMNIKVTVELKLNKSVDVSMDMIDSDNVLIGDPVKVTFKIKNNSDKVRNVDVMVTAKVVAYTGVPGTQVKQLKDGVSLQPGQESYLYLNINPTDYLDKLVDMAMMRMHALARVVETNQVYCEVDDFRLKKPDIIITAPESVVVGEEFIVRAEFKNPLQKPLTRGEFTVEGPGLQKPLEIICRESIAPGEVVKVSSDKLTAKKPGERVLIVTFDSLELSDLADDADILVKPA
ncbi:unnamed protein product [Owenia fusiformis]|uniref:Uncharacterized protein n=1 Tax=Owenia fusiformis TaxID=6347 RepID=A0A8J1TTW9_OWEFU|nr:unnamed protein product [Owenia fusiformis]